jgi:3-hydroxyisobutyrate dehydrogenase-like beta-hydroxyacid dehydrogenase
MGVIENFGKLVHVGEEAQCGHTKVINQRFDHVQPSIKIERILTSLF